MADCPLVSVIMPAYNQAKYIGKTISSVLSQTYKNIELIVVDNDSLDNTRDVVASFKDQRIKYFTLANNGTVSAPRNFGLKVCTGDYIAFLDSDDVWLPGKIECQLSTFKTNKNAVMVYSRYKTISGENISKQVFPSLSRCANGDVFRALYLRPFVACSGVMLDRSVLSRTGTFSEERLLVAAEDTDLWLRVARAGNVYCTSIDPFLLYRIHPASISQGNLKRYKRAIALAVRYRGNVDSFLFLTALIVATLAFVRQQLLKVPSRAISKIVHGYNY